MQDQGSLILAPPRLHLVPRDRFPLPGWLSPGPRRTPPGSRAEGGTVGCFSNLHPSSFPSACQHPLSSKTPSRGGSVAACQWFELLPTPFYKRHGEQIRGYKHLRRKEENSFGLCKGTSSAVSPRWKTDVFTHAPESADMGGPPPFVGYNQGSRAGKCSLRRIFHVQGHCRPR